MLKKRIIPCLDIKDGRTVKGVNFLALRDAGDPVELAKKYANDGADELVFLDITASVEKRKILLKLVERVAKEIHIPFTVGGGISSIDDVSALLNSGADKISINSTAVNNPKLIKELSSSFGSQCIVVGIDGKIVDQQWKVVIYGGRKITDWSVKDWVRHLEELGAGEILLTSMEKDGTKSGFDHDLTQLVNSTINIPVIASGGAGNAEDFKNLFTKTNATGGLAASIFHFNEVPIPILKTYLRKEKIAIR